MLEFHEYQPGPALRPWVQSLWLLRGSAGWGPTRTRVLPFGGVDWVLDLNHRREGTAAATAGPPMALALAPNHSPFHMELARNAFLVGVRFRYGGAGQFLDRPMAELVRRGVVPTSPWLCSDARALREQGDVSLVLSRLEGRLLERLDRRNRPDPEIQALLLEADTPDGDAGVAGWCRRVGVSERQLQRHFVRHFGIPPRAQRRLTRFHRVMQTIRHRADLGWAELAVQCGYYDQAHLIRDFRLYTGLPPLPYLREDDGRGRVNLYIRREHYRACRDGGNCPGPR